MTACRRAAGDRPRADHQRTGGSSDPEHPDPHRPRDRRAHSAGAHDRAVRHVVPAAERHPCDGLVGELPQFRYTLANYAEVLSGQGMLRAFINTLLIAVPSTLIPLVLASMAYAFSWLHFRSVTGCSCSSSRC